MDYSGISRAQLVRELKEEASVLECCTAKCLPCVRAHFERELSDVQAFIAHLVESGANVVQTGKERKRCPHYKAIRRCYAIAKDRGLNVKDEPAMRRAFGRALGREVTTREELGASDWQAVGDMMKRGTLAW